MTSEPRPDVDPTECARVGECVRCAFARRITSARGSSFWLCERAAHDPLFPKYPRLPVIRCRGFTPASDATAGPPPAREC